MSPRDLKKFATGINQFGINMSALSTSSAHNPPLGPDGQTRTSLREDIIRELFLSVAACRRLNARDSDEADQSSREQQVLSNAFITTMNKVIMLPCDHRMVEGSPLRYQYDYQSARSHPTGDLFRPYLHVQHNSDYYPYSTFVGRMSEDLIPPSSPHSSQLSDSEGSISSIESSKPKTLKCCWRNCGVDFDTLDQLASHVGKVHGASGPAGLFYCGWEGCARNDRAFNARYKMLVHVRTHTNEKPHQCYQCDKSFSRAENLKIHIRSHSGEKPYVCPVPGCNKAYSNSSDRFKHTRTHQVDKPYQCKVPGCSKRYTDPSSLRKHVKTYNKHFTNETTGAKNLKEFSHFKENEYNWGGIIDRKIFVPYEMDIDAPLDLSISRKS